MPEETQPGGESEGCGDWSVRTTRQFRISGAENYDYNFYSVEENKSVGRWLWELRSRIRNI
ncbi:MAG TPA: hypothetical protein VN368_02840 [Candidatus Methylomirabilis sp.]|nr:hypothetical protein [Candidatus Methylomirabilis sp.]